MSETSSCKQHFGWMGEGFQIRTAQGRNGARGVHAKRVSFQTRRARKDTRQKHRVRKGGGGSDFHTTQVESREKLQTITAAGSSRGGLPMMAAGSSTATLTTPTKVPATSALAEGDSLMMKVTMKLMLKLTMKLTTKLTVRLKPKLMMEVLTQLMVVEVSAGQGG